MGRGGRAGQEIQGYLDRETFSSLGELLPLAKAISSGDVFLWP